jgi:hypothetical protein
MKMHAPDEIRRLERSRSNWRTCGIGLIGLITGGLLAGAVKPRTAPSEVASVIIDNDKSSGRWDSTLIAVMDNGDIMYLDTTRPKTAWIPYKYSPGFSGQDQR